MTAFGAFTLLDRIEAAALATLWHWLPTYLSKVEVQAGLTAGDIPRPESWKIIASWDELDTDGASPYPALAVISPGATDLQRNSRMGHDGWANLTVGAAVSAENRRFARITAQRLCVAAWLVLLDKHELRADLGDDGWSWDEDHDPIAEGVRTLGPDLTQTPPGDRRNRAACTVDMGFYIPNLVTQDPGPEAPGAADGITPVPDWPTADAVDIDIDIAPNP